MCVGAARIAARVNNHQEGRGSEMTVRVKRAYLAAAVLASLAGSNSYGPSAMGVWVFRGELQNDRMRRRTDRSLGQMQNAQNSHLVRLAIGQRNRRVRGGLQANRRDNPQARVASSV